MFAQAYRQLCDTDPKVLRTVWDGERVFQVRSVTSQVHCTSTLYAHTLGGRDVVPRTIAFVLKPTGIIECRFESLFRILCTLNPSFVLFCFVCSCVYGVPVLLSVCIRSTLWERTELMLEACSERGCRAWWKTFSRQTSTSWCCAPTDGMPWARWVVPYCREKKSTSHRSNLERR